MKYKESCASDSKLLKCFLIVIWDNMKNDYMIIRNCSCILERSHKIIVIVKSFLFYTLDRSSFYIIP